MRIVVIGANGNVGTEVTLRLAARRDIDLVPVSRTRGGSVYLRYKGVRCLHIDVTDPASAGRALTGADVVASLALPRGDPARARRETWRLLASLAQTTPADAALVFFSTLAVEGEYSPDTRRFATTQYGRTKKWAERQFLSQAKRHGKQAFVIRLGHVIGELQPFSRKLGELAAGGSIDMVDANCASNVVHTVMIAELLHSLGRGRGPRPGRYDLVNAPNWTWRRVVEHEARCAGLDAASLQIQACGPETAEPRGSRIARGMLGAAIRSKFVARTAMRLLARLPPRFEARVRATYQRQLVRECISGREAGPMLDPAFHWPALGGNMVPGMAVTAELLGQWPMLESAPAWPPDLEPAVSA